MNKTLKTIAAAGCAAASLTLGTAAFAQGGAPTPLSTGPVDQQVNYANEFNINHYDIDNAKVEHYSDEQVAKIYKISMLSHESFSLILEDVNEGQTFWLICERYGIPYNQLNNVHREEEQITQFEAAMAASGLASTKRRNVLGSGYPAPTPTPYMLRKPSGESNM
jgi:hypothetical protein